MRILDITGKTVPACAVIECNGFNLSLSTIFGTPGELRVFNAKTGADVTSRYGGRQNDLPSADNLAHVIAAIQADNA